MAGRPLPRGPVPRYRPAMRDETVTITRAGPDRAEAVLALLVECGREMSARGLRNWDPPPASAESIRAEAVDHVVLVALTGAGDLVGTVTLRGIATHEYEPDVRAERVRWGATSGGPARYMNRLAVHPAWQRTGLGARLLAAAESEARDAGAAALRFDVLEANPALIRWYERRGCERRGRRRHGGKDFVVMEKRL